jgi:hypothetical protein
MGEVAQCATASTPEAKLIEPLESTLRVTGCPTVA